MSKAYFEKPSDARHRVTVKLAAVGNGYAQLEVRTNADEGQLARHVGSPWGYSLKEGEEVTVVIEN